eukprot:COSAG05_NODE_252_length_12865_cov_30.174761_7_plen_224_part_00
MLTMQKTRYPCPSPYPPVHPPILIHGAVAAQSSDLPLEVGDQVVVVEIMGSGQRSILRCEAANTAAGTSTILAAFLELDSANETDAAATAFWRGLHFDFHERYNCTCTIHPSIRPSIHPSIPPPFHAHVQSRTCKAKSSTPHRRRMSSACPATQQRWRNDFRQPGRPRMRWPRYGPPTIFASLFTSPHPSSQWPSGHPYLPSHPFQVWSISGMGRDNTWPERR